MLAYHLSRHLIRVRNCPNLHFHYLCNVAASKKVLPIPSEVVTKNPLSYWLTILFIHGPSCNAVLSLILRYVVTNTSYILILLRRKNIWTLQMSADNRVIRQGMWLSGVAVETVSVLIWRLVTFDGIYVASGDLQTFATFISSWKLFKNAVPLSYFRPRCPLSRTEWQIFQWIKIKGITDRWLDGDIRLILNKQIA